MDQSLSKILLNETGSSEHLHKFLKLQNSITYWCQMFLCNKNKNTWSGRVYEKPAVREHRISELERDFNLKNR